MLRTRKLWLFLALMIGALLFYVGSPARAKKTAPSQQGPVNASEVTSVPEPGLVLKVGEPKTYAGIRGTSVTSAVVNFKDLAKKRQPIHRKIKDDGEEGPESDIEGVMEGNWKNPNAPASAKTAKAPTDSRKHIQAGVPSPAPSSSFLAYADDNRVIPPDSHGAVGPNHVITATNSNIRIHDRNGNTISTTDLDLFWSALGNPGTFDPRYYYDPFGQRWITVVTANSFSASSSLLIGVTPGSDPTAQWRIYRIDADSADANWADYPTVGFTKDWITVGVNMFTNAAGAFTRVQIYAFDKANLYAGGTQATHTLFNTIPTTLGATFYPVTTYDNSLATQYLVNRFNSAAGTLGLFTISGPVATPTFADTGLRPASTVPWTTSPPAASADESDFALQAGALNRLQNNDSRMQSAIYRNGSIWCAHTIFLPAGGRPTRSAVQWWQINPSGGTVQQRAVIDDPTNNMFYAFPSIAVNVNNDALVGYSRFSQTQFASANYAFRAAGDPLNTLREDSLMKSGEGAYQKAFSGGTNRWGDYSTTTVDPTNDVDMWTIQEYAGVPSTTSTESGRWSTWWAKVRADGTVPGPAATPQVVSTPLPTLPAPANDNFANARVLAGCSGATSAENFSATKETGEPEHAPDGNTGGKSVWFRWQAPANGTVAIDTNSSTFDTVMGVYTGSSVSGLTAVVRDDDGGFGLNSRVSFAATSGVTYQIAVDGYNNGPGAESGDILLSWDLQGTCTPSTLIQFTRPVYSTLESTGSAVLTLRRQGNIGSPSTVDFQTTDGTAQQRTDYTISVGTVTFAANQSFATIAIPVTDDAYQTGVEGNETLTVTLSNPTNGSLGAASTATLTIVNNEDAASPTNPIATSRFFVRQQYADFLSREPDQGGFDYWTGELTSRTGSVLSSRRWEVSNAFFFELEYQQTGAYVYRLYRASFGNTQPQPNPETALLPDYSVFAPDRARVVGGASLAASQVAFANAFVQRAAFTTKYPSSLATGAQFVDAVLATLQNDLGVNLSSQRTALIAQYDGAGGGNAGRAQVMYRLSDDNAANPISNTAFINAEYNRSFVATQYYGYLRRNPDLGGFNFWLGILNRFPPRSVPSQLAMVCAFSTSQEYQERFSPLSPRNNGECPAAP